MQNNHHSWDQVRRLPKGSGIGDVKSDRQLLSVEWGHSKTLDVGDIFEKDKQEFELFVQSYN